MDAGTRLRQAVAGFFDVDESQVGPSFSLQACNSSIGRAALDAAIRRGVGAKSPDVYTARTFADLAAGLGIGTDGASASPVALASTAPASSLPDRQPSTDQAGASCGVDIELIEHLPVVDDPWEDPFYQSHFSPSEIAYCLRQTEPSPHFAARWCAKEALKKCDRAFLAIEGKDVEIVHDDSGAPSLVYLGSESPERLPHAVSLSHTPQAAIAMVVRVIAIPPASPVPLVPVAPTIPDSAEVVPSPEPLRRSRLPLVVVVLLNLISLGLAAAALYRTFPGLGGRG